MANYFNKFINYFQLGDEKEDFESVHAEIEKGIVFEGTNLLILICAIFVASVGLNMNSTAVIIGAMLISPLMGPINGMGYGIATYNFDLLKRAVKNYTFALVVSLLTSAFYFLISPVSSAHSELLARTSPTIFDVFIALFGGLAGMLAMSSKLKGNVIPGVAIATALMPPICTAGYGIANLESSFIFGALYLFTINTVFIAVGAIVVAQILKFPITTIVDAGRKRKINRWLSAILILTIIPSIFFGYKLVQNERFSQNSEKFVESIGIKENSYLIDHAINSQNHTINLIYSGYGISDSAIKEVKMEALNFGIDSTRINIKAGTDAAVLENATERMQTETEKLNNQLNLVNLSLQQSKEKLDSLKNIPQLGAEILSEIKQLYPQIHSCSYSETTYYSESSAQKEVSLIVLQSSKTIYKKDRIKIENWLKSRIDKNNIKVVFD